MKKLLVFALVLIMGSLAVNAQSAKDIRKMVKQYEKEGWVVPIGKLPLATQIEESLKLQAQRDENGEPVFVEGSAQAVGQNYDGAKMQALEVAKINIAGSISTEITAMVENTLINKQLSPEEAATITKTVEASKGLITQRIGRLIIPVECYRELKNRNKEVRVVAFFKYKDAMNDAVDAIQKELEDSGARLHDKLDKLLGLQRIEDMIRKIILSLLLLLPLSLSAKGPRTYRESGSYTFVYPTNIAATEIKVRAIHDAKTAILEAKFGRDISQHNSLKIINGDNESKTEFNTFSTSNVDGRWLETIGEPIVEIINIDLDKGLYVVEVFIEGIIQERTSAVIDIDARLLRNGTDLRYEDTNFRDGDYIHLYFRTPTDGYITIFLDDNDGHVVYLRQYKNSSEATRVDALKTYTLLKSDDYYDNVVEYNLSCDSGIEDYNTIHIIFSPNYYTISESMVLEDEIYTMESITFNKWLGKLQQQDSNITHKAINITIKPNN